LLDGISVKLLKLTSDAIVDILTCVLNFSIETNNFENDWKRVKISPIFKTRDEHMVNNYRPVSVLPIISKIIEKHVFNSFDEYLSENHLIITSSQSGTDLSVTSCEVSFAYIVTLEYFKHLG
jgi:hypothetical protein